MQFVAERGEQEPYFFGSAIEAHQRDLEQIMICAYPARNRHEGSHVAQRCHEKSVGKQGSRKLGDGFQHEVTHQHVHHPDHNRIDKKEYFVLDKGESPESYQETLQHVIELAEEPAAVPQFAHQHYRDYGQRQYCAQPPEDDRMRFQGVPYIVDEESPETPPGENQRNDEHQHDCKDVPGPFHDNGAEHRLVREFRRREKSGADKVSGAGKSDARHAADVVCVPHPAIVDAVVERMHELGPSQCAEHQSKISRDAEEYYPSPSGRLQADEEFLPVYSPESEVDKKSRQPERQEILEDIEDVFLHRMQSYYFIPIFFLIFVSQ